MKPNERKARIVHIDRDLQIINTKLAECLDLVENIARRYREERKDLLLAVRRQTRRSQVTYLMLKVYVRKGRALPIPNAEWRKVTARGAKVSRAQTTMARAKGRGISHANGKGQMGIFSNAIPKGTKKFGWRLRDLQSHAHPAEYELVKEIETELQPLRKRIAGLRATGTRLLQSRHRQVTLLDSQQTREKPATRKRAATWLTEHQLNLELRTEGDDKIDPPQYRKPQG